MILIKNQPYISSPYHPWHLKKEEKKNKKFCNTRVGICSCGKWHIFSGRIISKNDIIANLKAEVKTWNHAWHDMRILSGKMYWLIPYSLRPVKRQIQNLLDSFVSEKTCKPFSK